jgi:16S rRNA (guanine527-N7)-methyltransferase
MVKSLDLLKSLLPLQGLVVPEQAAEQLAWLAEELLRWSKSRNLTAISQPEEVVEKHLIDCLTLSPHLPARGRLLDIGSGAGFPALPIKIVRPQLEVVSVDAVAKKIMFQRHVARALKLEKFTAVHGRVEDCLRKSEFAAGFDLVTTRAVGRLPLLLDLAKPFLKTGGELIAMKGPEGPEELNGCRDRLLAEGWSISQEVLSLPVSRAGRCLLFFRVQKAL